MRALPLAAVVVLVARIVQAGTISITLTVRPTLADGKLGVQVKVANGGDEAAQSVAAVLGFRGQTVRGTLHQSLEPKQSFDETLTLPAEGLADGRWPFRLAVDYTDANQYPFQALQVQLVTAGSPPPAKVGVVGVKASGGIAGSGDLDVSLKNLGPDPRTVVVGAMVPDGLEATQPGAPVTLAGWAQQDLAIPVTNRTALPGSRYPVFVVVEYDDGPVHQAAFGQGVVDVVGEDSFLDRNRRWLVGGAIALVVLWIAVVVVAKLRA